MRAEVKAGPLRAAVLEAGRYAAKNSPNPAMNDVMLRADAEGRLTVCGTDGYRSLEARVSAVRTEPGKALVEGPRLAGWLRTLKADDLARISVEPGHLLLLEHGELGAKTGGGEVRLAGMSPDSYPDFPAPTGDLSRPFVVSGADLALAARRTASNAEKKTANTRWAISGCLVTFEPGSPGGRMRIIGTTGSVFSEIYCHADGAVAVGDDLSPIIPATELLLAADVFAEADEVRIQFDQRPGSRRVSKVWIESDRRRIYAALTEGQFPSRRSDDMRPSSPACRLSVAAGRLRSAAEQAEIAVDAEADTQAFAFEAEGGIGRFVANRRTRRESVFDFDLETPVEARFGPVGIPKGVVAELLREIGDDVVVRFEFPQLRESPEPVFAEGDHWRYLFMPVTLETDEPEPVLSAPGGRRKVKAGRTG